MQSIFLSPTEKALALPMYLTGAGHKYEIAIDRPHGFPDFHWVHTLAGQGFVDIDGQTQTLGQRQGFLMYPHVPHRYRPDGAWEVMWLTFNGQSVERFLNSWGINTGFVKLTDLRAPSDLIADMLALGLDHSPMQGPALATLIFRFLTELLRQVSTQPDVQLQKEKLQPLLDFVADNLDLPHTLTDMAALLHITPQHLCRLFQAVFGTTPVSYLVNLRISQAKSLLIDEPDRPIADIGRAVGYPNHSYFCSVFKRSEQRTPTEFRALRLGRSLPPADVELEY